MLKDIVSLDKRWFEFVFALTQREIKARYKHAIFGFLWAFLNPILQMLVMGFIFHFFVPITVDNYFVFLFSGLLPWNFFSQTLSKSIPSIVYERALIQKSNFPREAIIVSIVFSNLYHLLISTGIFLLYLLLFYDAFELLNILYLFFGIFLLAFFTLGFSLLFSSLNVRFRDVNFFVQALLPLWFYATPIMYTANLIPENYRLFLYLNPLTVILDLFHKAISVNYFVPTYYYFFNLFIILLFLMAGISVFKRESKFFDDWI